MFSQEQPNIILIVADELGCRDIGVNSQAKIKTPHLDQLATGKLYEQWQISW